MATKITGVDSVNGTIFRLETDLKKRVGDTLDRKAVQVRDLARAMAPLDEGNLEEAIKIRSGATRSENGQFAKAVREVYIDGDMPIPDKPGHTVGEYAYEMHEYLEPYGHYNLGEKSVEKQQSNGGVTVGGKFMERAALEVEQTLDVALAQLLKDLG